MDAAIFDRLQALASAITHEGYNPDAEDRAFIKKHGKRHLKRLNQLKNLGKTAKDLGYGNVLGKEFDKGDWTNISHTDFTNSFKKAKKLLDSDTREAEFNSRVVNENKRNKAKPNKRLVKAFTAVLNNKGKISAGAATIGIAAYMLNRKETKQGES